MKIIDLFCGNRAIWYNKNHPLVTYVDHRESVKPDIVADSGELPKIIGVDYDLVILDPPHMNMGKKSDIAKRYGHYTTHEILTTIERVGDEAHRISKESALMVLKWNDHDIKLKKVLDLLHKWEPLCGHLTKDEPGSKTYWVLLKKWIPYGLKT